MKEFLKANQIYWDEITPIHTDSEFYNVDEFVKGENKLIKIVTDEVGDVKSKKLLHLQCHFGLDTLSWARSGAFTTGVDFSLKAIDFAKSLALRLNINSEFICSEVTELNEKHAKASEEEKPEAFLEYVKIKANCRKAYEDWENLFQLKFVMLVEEYKNRLKQQELEGQ